MKSFFLYITAAAALLTTACNRQHEEEEDPVIPVTGVTLNPSSVSLLVGATLVLEAAVEPADATNQTVTWSTSDAQVATVNTAGVVTAVAPGTATITATTDDGKFTTTCAVTVTEEMIHVYSLDLIPTAASLLVGETLTLNAMILPVEAANQTVTWSTSDASVATVNTEGEVTAVAPGTATITATIVDGEFTATCAVTVDDAPYITMISQASKVLINVIMPFSEDFAIDWGNGEKSNIYDDSYPQNSNSLDLSWYSFEHIYSNISEQHITITGGNIEYLGCSKNQLKTLNVSQYTALKWLDCADNQIKNLDVSNNTEIFVLLCEDNELTSLDVNNNIMLYQLYCARNQLSACALNDLFNTLPYVTAPHPILGNEIVLTMYISGNPGASDCDFSIAEGKGWMQVYPKTRSIDNPYELYLEIINQLISMKSNKKK